MATFPIILLFLKSTLFIVSVVYASLEGRTFSKDELNIYRDRVVKMFQHGYESYIKNAYPYDELRPLSCDGVDTWGSFSLSLVDTLDTLIVLKNYTEFEKVVEKVIQTSDFNMNINVSVFETNIRVVGGLLSAHLLSYKSGMRLEPGWPCAGPLLNLAEKVARRLLPAFDTPTGMPYGTVNLRYGVPPGETPITCTAGVATFTVEFGTLSRLTGDPIFEQTALRGVKALWQSRSQIGLLGNHINVQDGKWAALDAGIGAGVDSYLEYLVKGAALLRNPKMMKMFNEYKKLINKHMKRDDWFVWVSMASGHVTMPVFQSLEAFWPGLLTLVGDITQAQATLYNYHQVLRQYGFTPESYDITRGRVNQKREGNPLRPELIESIMYLYQATSDPFLLQMGVDILESIEHSARTDCGYATVKNVRDHKIEDRMESFFLAETIKYLYLLFDTDNFIHNNGGSGQLVTTETSSCLMGAGGYVFNTEAHPMDIAALNCCSKEKKYQDQVLKNLKSSLNLFTIMDITNPEGPLNVLTRPRRNIVFGKLADHETVEDYFDIDWDFANQSDNVDSEETVSDPPEEIDLNESLDETDRTQILLSPILDTDFPNTLNMVPREIANDTATNTSFENQSQPLTDGSNQYESIISKNCDEKVDDSDLFINLNQISYKELNCPAQPFISRFLMMGQVLSPDEY